MILFPERVGRKQVGAQGTGPGLWVERKWQEQDHLHPGDQKQRAPSLPSSPQSVMQKVSEVNEGSAGTTCQDAVMPLKTTDTGEEI